MVIIGDKRSSHVKKWFKACRASFSNDSVFLISDYGDKEIGSANLLEPLIRFASYAYLCLRILIKVLTSECSFHIHSVSRYSILSLLIPDNRLFSYPYGSDVQYVAVNNAFIRKLIVYNLQRSAMIVASSNSLKQSVFELGITNQVLVVPFGVDSRLVLKKKSKLGLNSSDELVIGCFKYCKYDLYGYNFLLECVSLLQKKLNIPVKLLLINAGPDLDKLKEKISSLSINGNVEFLPSVSSQDGIFEYLKRVDMTIYCSMRESFGVCLLESMASGKPSFVAETGGLKEIVDDGKNGYFISSDNVSAAVQKIINLHNDKHLYSKIANSGLETVKSQYVWEDNFAKFHDAFQHAQGA